MFCFNTSLKGFTVSDLSYYIKTEWLKTILSVVFAPDTRVNENLIKGILKANLNLENPKLKINNYPLWEFCIFDT